MSDEILIGYFDGACEPFNPGGLATGGWVIPDRGEKGCAAYCKGDGATSNVAEYSAAIDCLRAIYSIGWRGRVLLHGDSMLVVKQFSGEWQCKADHLRALRDKLRYGASFFREVRFEHIPREQNTEADTMSRLAFERHAVSFGFKPKEPSREAKRIAGWLVEQNREDLANRVLNGEHWGERR
jgi:ribonuclease HI